MKKFSTYFVVQWHNPFSQVRFQVCLASFTSVMSCFVLQSISGTHAIRPDASVDLVTRGFYAGAPPSILPQIPPFWKARAVTSSAKYFHVFVYRDLRSTCQVMSTNLWWSRKSATRVNTGEGKDEDNAAGRACTSMRPSQGVDKFRLEINATVPSSYG